VTTPTHDRSGLLDVVAARDDSSAPTVEVINVGLSDHHLLLWAAPLVKPCPVYSTMTSRPWRQLDVDAFLASLSASTLCRPDAWSALDVDGLVQLYNDEITAALDRLILIRTVRCRRRPSDPWFDVECRTAKRHCRRLEQT